MKGKKSAEVGNLINAAYADQRLGDLIDDGEKVADLLQHPGWALLDGILDQLAEDTLFDIDARTKPLELAQYAQKHGFRNGLRVAADIAESFRLKAQEAVAEIERHDAELASERT